MSDYRIDGDLGSEDATYRPTVNGLDDLDDGLGGQDKVTKTLDKAEDLAAERLGAAKAHELREQADVAIARGQTLYQQACAFLDDQLAIAPYRTVAAAAFVGLLAGVLLTPRQKRTVYVRER